MSSLSIGNIPIAELAARFGTPIFVYDEARIRENIRRMRHAFESAYPDTRFFYAMKTNSHPAICRVAQEEGMGMDVTNAQEIALVQSVGVEGQEILFSGNFLSDEDLRVGVQSGALMNLDDISLLPRLLTFGVPETLSFRVNPGIGKSNVGEGDITAGPRAKFGIAPHQILEAYRMAKEAGVKQFGVHMMTGGCVTDAEYFREITEALWNIIGPVAQELDFELSFFDIGGGLGVPYRPGEQVLDLTAAAEGVAQAMREGAQTYGMKEPTLFLEPGRYAVADAGFLLGRVVGRKEGYRTIFGSDIGMNLVPRVILYKAFHQVRVDGKEHLPKVPTNLSGQICEQTDLWWDNQPLPPLEVGDLLLVENCGAYCFGMCYRYNGRLLPAEVLVSNGEARLIREKETVEDWLRGVR